MRIQILEIRILEIRIVIQGLAQKLKSSDFISAGSGSGIRISNADPDPGWPSQCGSGSETLLKILDFFPFWTPF